MGPREKESDDTCRKSRTVSIILPARNEARTLPALLDEIRRLLPNCEVVVVDDGSVDQTAQIAVQKGATLIRHPYPKGNGAAAKSGARKATGDILMFLDADGQHDPREIHKLVERLNEGYEMVVGSRGRNSQANVHRSLANGAYNWLASWMVGHRIPDLTSGFRAVDAEKFREFIHLLPNGFSYPTTITMAFFRAGYSVDYVPIRVRPRTGKSHIRLFRDGARFLLIIFKIGSLYSPLKLFLPASSALFATGMAYYLYTFATIGRFTNMSALLFIVAVVVFLIGLVSEQITALTYRRD